MKPTRTAAGLCLCAHLGCPTAEERLREVPTFRGGCDATCGAGSAHLGWGGLVKSEAHASGGETQDGGRGKREAPSAEPCSHSPLVPRNRREAAQPSARQLRAIRRAGALPNPAGLSRSSGAGAEGRKEGRKEQAGRALLCSARPLGSPPSTPLTSVSSCTSSMLGQGSASCASGMLAAGSPAGRGTARLGAPRWAPAARAGPGAAGRSGGRRGSARLRGGPELLSESRRSAALSALGGPLRAPPLSGAEPFPEHRLTPRPAPFLRAATLVEGRIVCVHPRAPLDSSVGDEALLEYG